MGKIFLWMLCFLFGMFGKGFTQQMDAPFSIERTVATQGFDGKMCWVHARAGAIPDSEKPHPTVVMTLQKLQLSGSDVFYALNEMRSEDGGDSWTQPVEHSSFARAPFSFGGRDDLEITVCDFSPKWHAHSGKLLGTGHTVVYENNRVRSVRPRATAYAVYDQEQAAWSRWRTIEMPKETRFGNSGAGCVQRLDLKNGDILLPTYFKEIGKRQYATTVMRCEFDGETLHFVKNGNALTVPIKRGLYEPSITEFGGRYFLTMRNDDHGYVSINDRSESLTFSKPKKWTFDDGTELGNYNTQQHWLRHQKHGLWLVYTRRGANNDHVFRHRAPLFVARVDPQKLHVIRETERVLVPEFGARLGNFGITEVSQNETWVTVTEWMQGPGPNYRDPQPLVARGSNNRVWIAKVKWNTAPKPVVQRHGNSWSNAAVAVENAVLAHTTQLIANQGSSSSTTGDEIRDVVNQLDEVLRTFGSSMADLIKLNLYVADQETNTEAIQQLTKRCSADSRPAVATVITALPKARRFALDAVFVARKVKKAEKVYHQVIAEKSKSVASKKSRVSVLPRGDVVYVAGQAKPGDLATATTASLNGLLEALQSMQLNRSDIVQLKCFLQPMSQVEIVDRQIEKFFGDGPVPAVAHVEWRAGGSRPIEIELIAAAPLTNTTETVSFSTPPGLKSSPVFSRLARIHGDRRIYLSGLVSAKPGDGARQVDSIFQQLIRLLKPTGSNLRHLAKATYYVADNDASTELNQIRPHYYDPKRPPAASKAMVRGTGFKDRTVSVDIIAAPESRLNRILGPIAETLKPTRRVVYKTIGKRKLHLHIFEPPGHRQSDRRPVFLAIHGGGWTGGNSRSFYPFAAHFAGHGMVGISLEYRLMNPKQNTTVFDCVRDARSAVRWIRENAQSLGIDPSRIVVMGGSAGGHLAVSTALFDQINEESDNQAILTRPAALILMYPVIDTSSAGYGKAKIGERWRDLSPLHNIKSGLPSTLIFHGTADAVTPYVGAKKYHESSLAKGNKNQLITHPGGRHGYIIFDQAEYERALDRMKEFLLQQGMLSKKTTPPKNVEPNS